MALRLANKAPSVLRPVLAGSRQNAIVSGARHFATSTESKEVESKKKSASIIDALPGDSILAKTAYLTAGAGLATVAIAKEIYILNEETLVLASFCGLATGLYQLVKEPYRELADGHINRIKNVLVKAREDHKSAVTVRIDEVSQMKDVVEVTKDLFALSKETAQLEAEAFELKQKIAVTAEIKGVLDSWVRYEASVREREQKTLAAFVTEKIKAELDDPKIQDQILAQAVDDVEKLIAKSA